MKDKTKISLFRRYLLIDNEKSWGKEIWEWIKISLFSALVVTLIAYSETGEFGENFLKHSKTIYESIALLVIVVKLFYNFNTSLEQRILNVVNIKLTENVKGINDKVDYNAEKIDTYLSRSRIVFETGINDFDNDHLFALQRILNALPKEVNNICAIDNSDPISWWSDTMTGYLALLAKWKSQDSDNLGKSVSRIFVVEKNELMSPVFSKTITLHSLMGFKTIIFSKDIYERLFNEYKENFKYGETFCLDKKELFIWNDNEGKSVSINAEIKINRGSWRNINCYQSFWNIGEDKKNRAKQMIDINHNWKNYYNNNISTKDIIDKGGIWFDFVSYQNNHPARKINHWKNIPKQHLGFIEFLHNNSRCFIDGNQVKNVDLNIFGVEIKTSNCQDCFNEKCKERNPEPITDLFEFIDGEDIKNILVQYYRKLNNNINN